MDGGRVSGRKTLRVPNRRGIRHAVLQQMRSLCTRGVVVDDGPAPPLSARCTAYAINLPPRAPSPKPPLLRTCLIPSTTARMAVQSAPGATSTNSSLPEPKATVLISASTLLTATATSWPSGLTICVLGKEQGKAEMWLVHARVEADKVEVRGRLYDSACLQISHLSISRYPYLHGAAVQVHQHPVRRKRQLVGRLDWPFGWNWMCLLKMMVLPLTVSTCL